MTKIFTLLLLALAGMFSWAQVPFKSSPVYKDSSIIKAWATGIEVQRGLVNISDPSSSYNNSNKASFGASGLATGKSQTSAFDVVSLGDGGVATLTFDKAIKNGTGPDFAVFENSFSDTYLELAFVEVSSDGQRFVRFPSVSLTKTDTQTGSFESINPADIHNLAGKYKIGYGTPFELDDIKDSTGIDLNNIRFVRVIDVVGSVDPKYGQKDSKGNLINEPFPTAFHSCGFDLEAIAAINTGAAYTISSFDELKLENDAYWNGSDLSEGFSSGLAYFKNSFDTAWKSWSGFAYSNLRNDSTGGYGNQFSAITAGGVNAPDTGGTNYVIAYYSSFGENSISFRDSKAFVVNGLYLTNSAYAYFSMKDGDAFSKKFGGSTGSDPDYLKIKFWGERADSTFTDTLDFYLADFRPTDSTGDYILDSWKWLDMAKLGAIRKIHFSMVSTDNGDWGMNTPSYFCLDNLSVQGEAAIPVKVEPLNSIALKVYPNPFASEIYISGEANNTMVIYDLSGHVLVQKRIQSNSEYISLRQLSKGVYFLKVHGSKGVRTEKLIKK